MRQHPTRLPLPPAVIGTERWIAANSSVGVFCWLRPGIRAVTVLRARSSVEFTDVLVASVGSAISVAAKPRTSNSRPSLVGRQMLTGD